MTIIDNLNQGELADLKRRIRVLENRTTLNNSAIGRAGMEVYDGGVLNISNGNLIVNGTATISGVLNADGTVTLSGTVRISGPLTVSGNTSVTGDFTVTGPTKLNGKTDIGGNTSVTGTMDIKGKSTLQNDLTVQGGGKVKIGSMTLDPTIASGAMTFANGAQIFSNGATIQVFKGTSAVQVEDGVAKLMGNGGSYVTADSAGVRVAGGLRVVSPQTAPSGTSANVYMDASGNIRRIV